MSRFPLLMFSVLVFGSGLRLSIRSRSKPTRRRQVKNATMKTTETLCLSVTVEVLDNITDLYKLVYSHEGEDKVACQAPANHARQNERESFNMTHVIISCAHAQSII